MWLYHLMTQIADGGMVVGKPDTIPEYLKIITNKRDVDVLWGIVQWGW